MHIMMKGISHKTAPLWFREKFSMGKMSIRKKLVFLQRQNGVGGGIILSTCNRVEIYVLAEEIDIGEETLNRMMYCDMSPDEKGCGSFYSYKNQDAVRHLFRVASGIDSQVLGETQIMSQVRCAWEESQGLHIEECFALDELFRLALIVARRAHAKTAISQGNVSVSSVAMNKCRQSLKDLATKTVLIIGAGKVAHRMATYFKEERMHAIFVSNRTYSKARDFAKLCDGEVVHFDKLYDRIRDVDIVIGATSAPHAMIHYPQVADIMQGRRHPLLMIDLGVPRDIEAQIRDINGVALYDLDDLKNMIEENYALRESEIPKVEKIIDFNCAKFFSLLKDKVLA